eukprot:Blabericola_migrator_1__9545@NODE_519_length_7920_cov_50_641666_g397_i0_p5_GENE_NODE_519_length_7920_cov_50_641666_g397_i0NODE_519_length_7920_cov_50_641666_g397_i0_p5_ORF_typecomplete_len130_score11_96_NODE_519_length_7920_cov_50_641666_g397_i055575946
MGKAPASRDVPVAVAVVLLGFSVVTFVPPSCVIAPASVTTPFSVTAPSSVAALSFVTATVVVVVVVGGRVASDAPLTMESVIRPILCALEALMVFKFSGSKGVTTVSVRCRPSSPTMSFSQDPKTSKVL